MATAQDISSEVTEQPDKSTVIAYTCGECQREMKVDEDGEEGDDSIGCAICERWFHPKCVKVTKPMFNQICKTRGTVTGAVHWFCEVCDLGASKILLSVTQLKHKHAVLETKLTNQTTRIDGIDTKVNQHETEITNLRSMMEDQIQKQNDEMKILSDATRNAPVQDPVVWPQPGNEVQQVVTNVTKTVNDRLDRQNNMIIFKAPESNNILKEEVQRADKATVVELCRFTAEEDLRFTTQRLGGRTKKGTQIPKRGGPGAEGGTGNGGADGSNNLDTINDQGEVELYERRPLLVQFTDGISKAKVMKRLFRLGDDDAPGTLKALVIKHDMSQPERENDKKLRQKAKNLTDTCK